MATQRTYEGFFLGCMMLALGTAIFKPGIQGTLAQSTSKKNSSVGWGLFYWLVTWARPSGRRSRGTHGKGGRGCFMAAPPSPRSTS